MTENYTTSARSRPKIKVLLPDLADRFFISHCLSRLTALRLTPSGEEPQSGYYTNALRQLTEFPEALPCAFFQTITTSPCTLLDSTALMAADPYLLSKTWPTVSPDEQIGIRFPWARPPAATALS